MQGAEKHSVYPAYALAARRWIAGQNLYTVDNLKFRYSPLFAICFTPFSALPDRAGAIVWRLLNVAVFAIGLRWCGRRFFPRIDAQSVAVLFLIALPLTVPSLNNGQANPLMTGLLLCAVASIARERWTTSALFLITSIFLKLYTLAAAVLLALVYARQLIWRLMAVAIGALTLCFCLQSPAFVAHQFSGWFEYLRNDLRLDLPPDAAYRDLRLVLNDIGLHPHPLLYFILQLLSALAIAIMCIFAKTRHVPDRVLLKLAYSFVACWMLLLGPATESCTYILVAPVFGWLFIESADRSWSYRAALWMAAVLLTIGMIAAWFPFVKAIHALGEQPLGILSLLYCLLSDFKNAICNTTATARRSAVCEPAI